MLYVNSNTEKALEILVENYHLPLHGAQKISNIYELADYVFEKCYHLIPNDIKEFFEIGQEKTVFTKPDLIRHLITNAYMVQLIESEGKIHTSGAFFNRVYNFIDIAIAKNQPVWYLFEDKVVPRIAEEFSKKLSEHWMNRDTGKKANTFPSFIAPLIAFQAIHVDSHRVLKGHMDNQHSSSYFKQHKEATKKLHLHFSNNFKFLLDQFPNIDRIERLFENNQMIYHPVLNRILFEREYQIGLANKIAILTMNESEEIKLQYYRLLSALALLSNINGRLFYLPYIRTSGRMEKLSSAFIGMALITIPVMESYFLFLLKKKGFSVNASAMQRFMNEKDFFIDVRTQPEAIPGIRNQIFAAKLGLQWELADMPFEHIKNILIVLNKVAEIQTSHLNDIYLNPYDFLKNNGYDKYDLFLFNENKDRMIEALSQVVKEKYFDVLSA
ncbi:hypothetical protein [Paenibacillus macerans]|uniref:hypothetical protein n=1 Tax=Paenibacillus macerans TaxID=44252 RepID=UPI00203AF7CB|nr:hypothetical protein [Paenibacillus macerans]MCM3700341.1 hypothetical protein [Paenibacillus macerans]